MPAERLYYADATLDRFTAIVTDIREHSRADGASMWQVALDRTAFYPTSGGQPFDTGALTAAAPSGARLEAPVLDVFEDEQGEVWHLTQKPLLAGTAVEGAVDRARRFDHMQQHSGQHLLSALFDREYDARTVSFHLGEQVSTIDLEGSALDDEKLARIEALANQIVAEDRPVSVRTVPTAEAEHLLAAGVLRKLPPRAGEIRLIVIAGEPKQAELDVNACGGTHVPSTSRIGAVLLRGAEKIRQATRVSFVCGGRAIAAARTDDALLAQLSRELSATRVGMADVVTRLKTGAKALSKERQALREELADYHATRLTVEVMPVQDRRIVRRVFSDRDADYIKLLAGRLIAAAPHMVAILASTQQKDAPAAVVLAVGPELGHNAGETLRAVLTGFDGRGGGSPTLAQGLVPVTRLADALDALDARLAASA